MLYDLNASGNFRKDEAKKRDAGKMFSYLLFML